jgi:predicted nucleic acid-binding protein
MANRSTNSVQFEIVTSSPLPSCKRPCGESVPSTPMNSGKTSTRSSIKIRRLAHGGKPDRGLIDTSVAIALERLNQAALPAEIAISALTLAELTAGPHAATGLGRSRRRNHLQRIEASVECLDLDPARSRAYGRIYAATRAIGRKPRGARCVDLMIAATACAYGLPLYTLNASDIRGLNHLAEIVDLS